MKRGGPHHPKTLALSAALGVERCHAVGILESLWHFVSQYARRGDIGRHPDTAIAQGIGWAGSPAALTSALVETGWLDRCPCHRLRIHDWPDHADQGVQRTKEVIKGAFIECYGTSFELSKDASAASADMATGNGNGYRLPATATAGAATKKRPRGDAGDLLAFDTPENREIIEARSEIIGGPSAVTLPKLKAAGRFLQAGFHVEQARKLFVSIRDAPKGAPGLASFCSHKNRSFEYCLRPDVAQKILDEADAPYEPPARAGPTPRQLESEAGWTAVVTGGLIGDGTAMLPAKRLPGGE